jgi:hypothetical protein
LAFEKVSFLKFKFEKWCKNNNEKSTHAEEKLEKGSNFDRRDQSDKRLPLRYEWYRLIWHKIRFLQVSNTFIFDLTPRNVG